MKTIITLIILFGAFSIDAQSIERQVIGSTGGTSSTSSITLTSTVGEVAVATSTSASVILTAGYQQANDTNLISLKEIDNISSMTLYPNPTTNNSKLEIISKKNTSTTVSIYSTDGKLIGSQSLQLIAGVQSTFQLDVSSQSTGIYYVRISENNNSFVKTLRLVKY